MVHYGHSVQTTDGPNEFHFAVKSKRPWGSSAKADISYQGAEPLIITGHLDALADALADGKVPSGKVYLFVFDPHPPVKAVPPSDERLPACHAGYEGGRAPSSFASGWRCRPGVLLSSIAAVSVRRRGGRYFPPGSVCGRGSSLSTNCGRRATGAAVAAAARGGQPARRRPLRQGLVSGVLALGGSAGTTIGTAAMRALPLGVPKLMVSTLASGRCGTTSATKTS